MRIFLKDFSSIVVSTGHSVLDIQAAKRTSPRNAVTTFEPIDTARSAPLSLSSIDFMDVVHAHQSFSRSALENFLSSKSKSGLEGTDVPIEPVSSAKIGVRRLYWGRVWVSAVKNGLRLTFRDKFPISGQHRSVTLYLTDRDLNDHPRGDFLRAQLGESMARLGYATAYFYGELAFPKNSTVYWAMDAHVLDLNYLFVIVTVQAPK